VARLKEKKPLRELSTVESFHNRIFPEEFCEGPYGAAATGEKLSETSPGYPHQQEAPFHEDTER
jgi:hypothetical protein